MKKLSITLNVLFVFIVATISTAYSQSPQEILNQYISDLQKNPNDNALREKIIKLAQQLQPPPVVPEETIKYEGRAEAAVRNAKTPEDYLDASKEYMKTLLLAPWVASYYFNLGVVLEKAGKPDEAIKSLRLYLLAAPNAQDTREVQKRIAGLEYESEKQAKTKTEPIYQPPDISGAWSRWGDGKWHETMELRITERIIELKRLRWSGPYPPSQNWEVFVRDFDFDGKNIRSSPPSRYGNRILNWKLTIVDTNTMIEEWFYEGGEPAKRFQEGALRDYITSPQWYRFEWKRER
jgi:tetratricopeptide (TPR) repeat protein